mgnify:CR=1 FL=1
MKNINSYLKNDFVIVLILVTLAFILRIINVNHSLWLDESYSAYIVNLNWIKAWQQIKGDAHPPLYYILLKSWNICFGNSPLSLRMLSIIFGVMCVPITYFLAKSLFNIQKLALYTGLLYSISPVFIYYSQEIRSYSLLMLLSLSTSLAFIKLLYFNHRYKWGFLYCLFGISIIYTHYYGIFVLFSHSLYLIFLKIKRKQARNFFFLLSLFGIIAICYIPWVPTIIKQVECKNLSKKNHLLAYSWKESIAYDPAYKKPPFNFKSLAYDTIANTGSFLGIYPSEKALFLILQSIPFALLLFRWIALLHKSSARLIFIFCSCLIPFLIPVAISACLGSSVIARRYLVQGAIFFPIGIVSALLPNKVRQYYAITHLLVFVIMLENFCGIPRIYHPSIRGEYNKAAKFIMDNYHEGDVVIFNACYIQVPFDYYFNQYQKNINATGFPITVYSWWNSQFCKRWGGPVITWEMLFSFIQRYQSVRRIWLVAAEEVFYDKHKKLRYYLKQKFRKILQRRFENCEIILYYR